MSFVNKFFVSFFNNYVGEDIYGNKYYLGSKANYLNKKKRYVIYKGGMEPSKVPPLWHSWLHYLSDELPSHSNNYNWQQDYLPNLTGTKFSYSPKALNKLEENKIYNNWKPKN